MDDAEALRQIKMMISFILNEARDKAMEIEAQTMEDFNIEKLKYLQESKEKIRKEYDKKMKRLETERAIAKSMSINKQKIQRARIKEKCVHMVEERAKARLIKLSDNKTQYAKLLQDLIVQAAVNLLEPKGRVICRKIDVSIIEGILSAAAVQYANVIKKETGLAKTVSFSVDKTNFLPPPPGPDNKGASCCGGIVLANETSTIRCDNTLDTRVSHVMGECVPVIKRRLFPAAPAG